MSIYMWRKPWPLCFTANTANSTVQLTKTWTPTSVTLETSTNWTSWSSYTIGDTITLTNIWDKVYFRNKSETDTWFSTGYSDRYRFVMSGSISSSGDVTSLLNKNGTLTLSDFCFYSLFRECSLTTSPELPATTLAQSCYWGMFVLCAWLTTSPELPATTLAAYCYSNMFVGSGVSTAPELPATTLAAYCYYSMFQRTPLTILPKLPATTLPQACYAYMFQQCSNIKLSTTQTWDYQTAYRIPTTWTGSAWSYGLDGMFTSTWWTFTGTPSINTTYYTNNTLV